MIPDNTRVSMLTDGGDLMIPVVVISLERSADRRAYITEHLQRLAVPFRFFSAIDGARVSAGVRSRYEPTMPVGAVGCAESHLALLRELAEGSDEYMCILEDDAELAPDITRLLDLETLERLPSFDVLRLESRERRSRRFVIPIADFGRFRLVATYQHKAATTGQIFSRAGARKILAGISYLRVAIDIALYIDSYVMGLRVIETSPSLVRQHGSLNSIIGPGQKPHYSAFETFLMRRVRTRELRNIMSFVAAWRLPELVRVRLI